MPNEKRLAEVVRWNNLRALILREGGPTLLAKKLGHKSASYLSQLVSETRPLTPKAARKMEDQLGLPYLWFEEPHFDAMTEVIELGVDNFDYEHEQEEINRAMATVMTILKEESVEVGSRKFAELVALSLEYAKAGKAIDDLLTRRVARLLKTR